MYIRLEKSFNDYLRISYEGNGMWYYRLSGLCPDDNVDTWTMIDVVLHFLKEDIPIHYGDIDF
jgi:hypothetical protein